jgi:hypothetical protein
VRQLGYGVIGLQATLEQGTNEQVNRGIVSHSKPSINF